MPVLRVSSGRRNKTFKEVNLTIQETVTLVGERRQLVEHVRNVSQGWDGPGTTGPLVEN